MTDETLDEDLYYDITYRTQVFNTPSGWYMKGGSAHVIGVDGASVPPVISIKISEPPAPIDNGEISESRFSKFIYSVIDGETALSDILDFTDPDIPQYAKDVMYGFIEGHNAATRHITAEHIAKLIREIDGDHTMGAGALGEAIAARLKGEKNA
jgi:hypothetical protein